VFGFTAASRAIEKVFARQRRLESTAAMNESK
jgi:hypothetical protein